MMAAIIPVLLIVALIFAAPWVVIGYTVGGDPLWFLSGPRIWLTDAYGYAKCSRLRTDRNGVKWAYVYPYTKIGHVILLPDGSTTGETSYIKTWSIERPARPYRVSVEVKNAGFVGGRP